jgi:hypothetical protein
VIAGASRSARVSALGAFPERAEAKPIKQPERVAAGGDRGRAGVPLADQTASEELLPDVPGGPVRLPAVTTVHELKRPAEERMEPVGFADSPSSAPTSLATAARHGTPALDALTTAFQSQPGSPKPDSPAWHQSAGQPGSIVANLSSCHSL